MPLLVAIDQKHAAFHLRSYTAMPKDSLNVTEEQWEKAKRQYELDLKTQSEIARELGISARAVSYYFKKTGCKKGSRVSGCIVPGDAERTAKQIRSLLMHIAREKAALNGSASVDAIFDGMMKLAKDALEAASPHAHHVSIR